MKHLLLLAFLATAVSAETDVTGVWKVVFAGPPGLAPKTVGSMILDLKVLGNIVSGKVVIGVWPGEAPIVDGKMEGDHVTFTATGHLGSTTGIPTCKFDVTVQGDEMHVTMTAIKNAGGPLPFGYSFDYVGKRKPN